MSRGSEQGAHGHDEHAHGDHGGGGQHGGEAHGGHASTVAEAGAHGHAELPPAPAERHITPAPEDFANLPGPSALVWPFVWVGLAVMLLAALLSSGWTPFADAHAGDPATHGEAK